MGVSGGVGKVRRQPEVGLPEGDERSCDLREGALGWEGNPPRGRTLIPAGTEPTPGEVESAPEGCLQPLQVPLAQRRKVLS